MKKLLVSLSIISTIFLAGCHNQTISQPLPPPAAEQKSEHLSDAAISAKVKKAFVKEKIFGKKPAAATSVKVKTLDGVVYLRGTVANGSKARNAVKVAESVEGVKHVVSHLKVKGHAKKVHAHTKTTTETKTTS